MTTSVVDRTDTDCGDSRIDAKTEAKNRRWRFWFNVTAGCMIGFVLVSSMAIFVVVPQIASPAMKREFRFENFQHNTTRYNWPPPSESLMSRFRRAAITCDHGRCSEIGRDTMIRGGNAVDAMIASLFCLGVTNPQSSGIGGGFIVTIYNRTTRNCKVIDARETAPMNATRDMFGNDEWASKYGYRAIATPGELAGYWLAYREFGSGRVAWRDLVWPSVELARVGVPVSEYLGQVLAVKEKHIKTLPFMSGWLNNRTGNVYQFGDILKRPELADTLEKIALADDPTDLFYNGEMADTIVAEIQRNGMNSAGCSSAILTASSDYYVFRPLEHHLRGKKFEKFDDLKMAVDSFFESQPPELWAKGIGDLPIKWAKVIDIVGGILTKADLADYRPKIYELPLIADLPMGGFKKNLTKEEKQKENERRQYASGEEQEEDEESPALRMCGPPPPSSFVVTQAIVNIMVGIFGDHSREGNPKLRRVVLDDIAFYHWLIESQKLTYAQRTRLGDIDFVVDALELARNLTSLETARMLYDRLPSKAKEADYYTQSDEAAKDDHGTSHVSVIDPEGNGVSATSTVNRWFGAVVQSEALGIVWNDEMDDFSSPGMPNGFGFAPAAANFIEPGKRPMSSMSPMVIFDQGTGNLKFVIGASGGSKIISALAKPIIRVLCFNETIKEAIDAPTLHNQFTPLETQYEASVPKELIRDLETRYDQKLKPTTGFEGIVQGIYIADDGYIYANGDYRRRTNQHPEGF